MAYFITFLEGIITFISPCLLPMLPIYIAFFAGGNPSENSGRALKNAFGFVIGFSVVFVLLGVFAGAIGEILSKYQIAVNIISGLIVIIFGLNFIGIIKIGFLNKTLQMQSDTKQLGFFSSLLFGLIFSIGWTPCVGAFLGSALMLVAQQGSILKGILLMLSFSAGLGIPFVMAAILIDKLKNAFDFIKRHYRIINIFSGALLILVGILMATGYMNYFLSLLG